MISTSFWSADGKPISAEEFLNDLFGTLPELFKNEEELLKYNSFIEAHSVLGEFKNISSMFVDFQQYLYQEMR